MDSLESLEIFKTLPVTAPVELTLFWMGRLDLRKSIPTETILWIYEIHSDTLKKTLINSNFTFSVVYTGAEHFTNFWAMTLLHR